MSELWLPVEQVIAQDSQVAQVTAPPPELKVPAFYTKYISANGFPIVASATVNDYALKEAAYLVNQMLGQRHDIRDAMIASGARLCIIGYNEFTTDLPEFVQLGKVRGFENISAKDYWDARARGTGGSQTDPYCSCGEENLLEYPGDPYAKENILIHEFAHNMHLRGLVRIDPTFDDRVKAAHKNAVSKGLWKGKYASVNHHEYFAEGVQSWFDDNRENDHDHNHVNTRVELKEYDPELAALCAEVFGETEWRYTKPSTRIRDHLTGYDSAQAPRFVWPARLEEAQRAIRAQAVARSEGKPKTQPATERQQADQTQPATPLTIERIYNSGEFSEQGGNVLRFGKHGSSYYTWEKPAEGEKGRALVRHDLETEEGIVIVPAAALIPEGQLDALAVASYQFSKDQTKLLIFTNTRRVWRENNRGDYWVLDIPTRRLQKLGGNAPEATLSFARFFDDGSRVGFVRENNVYIQNLTDMVVTALTTDGSPMLINGTADWVNEEELDLRDCLRISPDGKYAAFWQFNVEGVRSVSMTFPGSGNYPELLTIPYPKVGETNSATRIGVVSTMGGPIRWINVPGDPREHYIPHVAWTPDSTGLVIQQLNRLQNRNVVFLARPESDKLTTILIETDAAWVENDNPIRWLNGGKHFLWMSERTGFRRLWLASMDGQLKPITPADFDVIEFLRLDEAGGFVYYGASPNEPTRRALYRSRLDGSATERLTPPEFAGWNTYQISPDAAFAVQTHSTITSPPATRLVKLPEHTVVREISNNNELSKKLSEQNVPQARLISIDIGAEVPLDAWVFSPPNVDPSKKYPLLIHVYGEPAGQTVRDLWMSTQGLWHAMLAQQGCYVVSIDNRGTNSPRGRAWRKSIYRQIGRLAAADQAAACRKLQEMYPQIDSQRVGIWGWSGGGSMSLNAILQYPDLYSTAVAVAAVPNQKLYDSIYQERYMGLPNDNEEGFRLGSPLTYAGNLRGNLLIIHGTGDDNVHYQGAEQLVDALVANNKFFSVMPYPGRSHGISEGTNTTRHLFTLMTRHFETHLLSVPPASQFSVPEADAKPAVERPVSVDRTKPRISTRQLAGWTLNIDEQLLLQQPQATARALQLLENMLKEIVLVVPPKAVEKLRQVPLWLTPEYPGTGPRAEYHPGEGWLKDNGRNPEMVKGVEFTNIRIFDAEVRRMPNFALHELAHAYHDQVLSFDHPDIRREFERAKSEGKYDRVTRQDAEGRKFQDRSYALASPMEFFAELTESYFSRNDFFPFDREELRQHDPAMYFLLGQLWGVEQGK